MCTQKSPYNWSEQLYKKHGETVGNYLSQKVLPAIQQKRNDLLLVEFVKRAENHTIMNKWHKNFFQYLVSALILFLYDL